MTGILSHFRIEALHNRHTIDIPITNNKLVLIGENGAGKSTVTNFMYFFLTRQWHRMLPYEFRRVVATIDNKDIEVTKEDLVRADDITTRFLKMFTPRTSNHILDIIATETIQDLSNPEHIPVYAAELGLPRSTFMQVLEQLLDSSEKLNQINQDLGVLFPNPILYLPAHNGKSPIINNISFSGFFTITKELTLEWKEEVQQMSKSISLLETLCREKTPKEWLCRSNLDRAILLN